MFASLRLGRVLGSDIFVHGTFWLLPAFIILSSVMSGDTTGLAMTLAVVFAVFGCVALHELGHAVAAGWYGIRTRDITLYPIGGVARLEGMPDRPGPEIVIALAGPAVNVVIAGVLYGVLAVLGLAISTPTLAGLATGEFLAQLLVINIGLVLFNLIPAFPMDGGRVFRALVNLFTDRLMATRIAVGVGSVMAIGMGLYGLYQQHIILMVLAGFVFMVGRAELANMEARESWKQRIFRRPRYVDDVPVARPAVSVVRRADGWEWNPIDKVWTFWENGRPVRRLVAD